MSYRYASGRASGTSMRSDSPLTDFQIMSVAPSVFAEGAHSSRKPTYTFVPTSNVLDRLRNEGFQPFEARQTRVRKEDKQLFTRHMLRLRHPDMIGSKESTPEIILLNSHDGSSSYQLLTGFFRGICDNGLVFGNVASDIRVHHRGNIGDNVIDGCIRVMDNLEQIQNRVSQYQSKILSLTDQTQFATRAMQFKWGERVPFDPSELLSARRHEDANSTLWSVFNTVQENLIRGGIAGKSASGRRTRSRAVTAIDSDIKINRSLWQLADEFVEA